jgi:hypothetical protein
MLLELDYAINHWVTVEEAPSNNEIVRVMDPWVGKIIDKPIRDICGYTDIGAVNVPAPELSEAEKEFIANYNYAIEHKITNGERPRDFVTREENAVMIARAMKKVMEWTKNNQD